MEESPDQSHENESAQTSDVPKTPEPKKNSKEPLIVTSAVAVLLIAALVAVIVAPKPVDNESQATKHEQPAKQEQTYKPAPSSAEKAPDKNSEAKPQTPPPAPKPTVTVSQSNALKSAGSYLKSVGGFSYSGLIEQLEYEKFSPEDATWAADNCGADWNAQAKQSAASYMKSVGGFSRGGLIEQLEYEGFTPEQAAIGADSVGL